MGREEQVVAAAIERGLDVEVRAFPKGTRTASDAAAAIGCDVAQIVKSLVFVVDDEAIVALVGGADRLDEARLATAAGGSSARRADAAEVELATGFTVGGVPPFGHGRPLRCVVDDALLVHDVVWVGAGTPTHVFATEPHALVAMTGADVATIRVTV